MSVYRILYHYTLVCVMKVHESRKTYRCPGEGRKAAIPHGAKVDKAHNLRDGQQATNRVDHDPHQRCQVKHTLSQIIDGGFQQLAPGGRDTQANWHIAKDFQTCFIVFFVFFAE